MGCHARSAFGISFIDVDVARPSALVLGCRHSVTPTTERFLGAEGLVDTASPDWIDPSKCPTDGTARCWSAEFSDVSPSLTRACSHDFGHMARSSCVLARLRLSGIFIGDHEGIFQWRSEKVSVLECFLTNAQPAFEARRLHQSRAYPPGGWRWHHIREKRVSREAINVEDKNGSLVFDCLR